MVLYLVITRFNLNKKISLLFDVFFQCLFVRNRREKKRFLQKLLVNNNN